MNSRELLALGREVLEIEKDGLLEVKERLGPEFIAALEMISVCRGRVAVTGVGKSGLVGRKIAATFSSTGTPAYFLHPVEGVHGDMGIVRSGDVAMAISNSGETGELLEIIPELKAIGVKTVALTGKKESSLAKICDAVIDVGVSREACPLGLAPTASTTAALAVGDALAVCLMRLKSFDAKDFKRYHPAGFLGRRLNCDIKLLMHTADLPILTPRSSMLNALEVMNRGGLGAVAIVGEDDLLAGIFTDGDLRRLMCKNAYDPLKPVEEYMTGKPAHVKTSQSAAEALDIMETRSITVLPVTDEAGRLAGLIHLHDLLGKGRFKFAG